MRLASRWTSRKVPLVFASWGWTRSWTCISTASESPLIRTCTCRWRWTLAVGCAALDELLAKGTVTVDAAGNSRQDAVYRSPDCHGCPLSQACRSEKAKRARSVSRDMHEDCRERMAAKMAREDSQAVYRKRLHTAETPFAVLKQLMDLRQLLLRGLENVKTEWLWACTAFNVAKLVRETARLRAKFAALAAEGAG